MSVSWNANYLPDRERELQRNLEKASILFVDKLKTKVSHTASSQHRYVGTGGIYIKNVPTSRPGDPPFVATGFLRNSITYEMGKLESKVGSNDPIAIFLELGTSRMAARPFLRPVFNAIKDDLANIIITGRK